MDNNILNIMYSDITNINIDYVCNHVKSNLITQFKDKWRKEISFNNLNISNIEDKQPKLRTYSLFKSEYKWVIPGYWPQSVKTKWTANLHMKYM